MKIENQDTVWGPNPELYERLSEPVENKAVADERLRDFMAQVKELREECGVPEVIVMAAVYHVDPKEKVLGAIQSLALGNPTAHADLGALAYLTYTKPSIERAEKLRAIAEGET